MYYYGIQVTFTRSINFWYRSAAGSRDYRDGITIQVTFTRSILMLMRIRRKASWQHWHSIIGSSLRAHCSLRVTVALVCVATANRAFEAALSQGLCGSVRLSSAAMALAQSCLSYEGVD